jgi:ABC-type uncharacterized transport system ATPase subunit
MFNGFFYSENNGRKHLQQFVDSVPHNQVLLIIDPPFGGMLSALRNGVNVIWKTIEQGLL